MQRHRPPKLLPPPLTVAEVLTWVDGHRERAGSWPDNALANAFTAGAATGGGIATQA
jgi:hypothetical protein